MRVKVGVVALVVIIIAITVLSRFVVLSAQTATLRGIVLGEAPAEQVANGKDSVGVAADVLCNGHAGHAAANGTYKFSLPQAKSYACTFSSPLYEPLSVTIPGDAGNELGVSFGSVSGSACAPLTGPADLQCPLLKLATGTITGTVTYVGTHHPASGAYVKCGNLATATHAANIPPLLPAAATKSDGTYTLTLPLGQYGCYATSDAADAGPATVTVGRDAPGQQDFALCQSHCPEVRYHGGLVMHSHTAYLIFWLPKGYVFEPNGDDKRYESLISRYFQDISGTPYYRLLTQYWDFAGHVADHVSLGGAYIDTTPYQHCATDGTGCTSSSADKKDALFDADILAEVHRAIAANPTWTAAPDHEFYVFTGYGAEECSSTAADAICTYTRGSNGFCAYHSDGGQNAKQRQNADVIYAYIPDHASDDGLCSWSTDVPSPNGDLLADVTINSVSHEHFESVTDPYPSSVQAWHDDRGNRYENEIGDKCEGVWGTTRDDGSNVTLAHGHRYILQAEWSNAAGGCAFG